MSERMEQVVAVSQCSRQRLAEPRPIPPGSVSRRVAPLGIARLRLAAVAADKQEDWHRGKAYCRLVSEQPAQLDASERSVSPAELQTIQPGSASHKAVARVALPVGVVLAHPDMRAASTAASAGSFAMPAALLCAPLLSVSHKVAE